ncbi:MAG: HEPN domain-containing protein [Rhodospirillales bacterium]|nr:HEPN domain-containing protein [Rhodospirillales bacterium]
MNGDDANQDAIQWEEARRWFARADDDLAAARLLLDAQPAIVRLAAFHCQQAAEKLLKGLLIAARMTAPKSHDLAALAPGVTAAFPAVTEIVGALRRLGSWYVAARYPDVEEIEAALVEKSSSAQLSKRASSKLEMLHEDYGFCDGASIPLVMDHTGSARLWTFAGSAVNESLRCAIARRGGAIKGSDNFSISLKSSCGASTSDLLARLDVADCRPSLPPGMEEALKFSVCVPPDEKEQILTERLRDVRGIGETLLRPLRVIRLDGRATGKG